MSLASWMIVHLKSVNPSVGSVGLLVLIVDGRGGEGGGWFVSTLFFFFWEDCRWREWWNAGYWSFLLGLMWRTRSFKVLSRLVYGSLQCRLPSIDLQSSYRFLLPRKYMIYFQNCRSYVLVLNRIYLVITLLDRLRDSCKIWHVQRPCLK